MRNNQVRPKTPTLTDEDARELLAIKLKQIVAKHGPKRVGHTIGCDEKTVRRARDEVHTLGLACTFNLLDLDPTALDLLAAARGYAIVPLEVDFKNDMEVIAELSGLLNEWLAAMQDFKRDNAETAKIAARIRQIMPKLRGVTAEDDSLKLRAVA